MEDQGQEDGGSGIRQEHSHPDEHRKEDQGQDDHGSGSSTHKLRDTKKRTKVRRM